MSVTFSAQQPIMAKAQFGHQSQAKASSTQFSSMNPANSKAASRTQFADGGCCSIPLACCCGPIVLGILALVLKPWNWFKG